MSYQSKYLRWNDPDIGAGIAALWDGEPSPDDQYFYRIGGPDEVRALIGDLANLFVKMGGQPPRGPHSPMVVVGSFEHPVWRTVATDEFISELEQTRDLCSSCADQAQLINRIRADATRINFLATRAAELEQWLKNQPSSEPEDEDDGAEIDRQLSGRWEK